jgi:cell division protein FtsI (penicillin-binding protein 3)
VTPPPRRPRTSRTRAANAHARRGRGTRPGTTKSRKVIAARPRVSRGRVITLLLALAMVGVGFGWRLVDLQLTPDEELANAIGSQVRSQTIAAPRGQILDRFGRPIALSLPRPSIVANPRLLQSADRAEPDTDVLSAVVDELAPLLSTSPDVLRERLSRDRAFVFLERQVDPDVGEAVVALELPGIYIDEEQRREHPNGNCSGLALVGRVDVDQVGVSGLELEFNDRLTGTPGEGVRQTQAGGEVRIPGGFQIIEPMEPGEDLTLTIDRNIQFKTEQLAIRAVDEAEADRGMVIVGDPRTGEIFAMVNVVRDLDTGEIECTTTNLAATWTYEPGSIMKPITFSSVFENGAMSSTAAFDIPQELRIDLGATVAPHRYVDRNVPPEGAARTPTWVLRKSSNNGTITMAQAVGADALYETMRDFGLGEPTTLGVSGEASGILDPLDSNALKLSNAAIGQGVAVSPIQMFQAFSTLAAGGLRFDPVVVMDDVGRRAPVRVVSEETADDVIEMMKAVVLDGTGRAGALTGYAVAGKTGTAWQPCAGGIGYLCADGISRAITASFAGIVENDSGPALTVIAVIDNPQGDRTGGGQIAAPLFAEVASYAVGQLRIAPLSDAAPTNERVRAEAAVPVTTLPDVDTDPVAT